MKSVAVALFTPPYTALTYALPDYLPESAWRPGTRVAAPLGRGFRAGVVLPPHLASAEREHEEEGGSSAGAAEANINTGGAKKSFTVKPLLWPLDKEPLLSLDYLDLAASLAHRQSSFIGQILGNVLPAGLRTVQARLRFYGEGRPKEFKISGLAALGREELRLLGLLWMGGRAEFRRQTGAESEVCALLADPPWPVRPAAKAQAAVLEYLHENGAVSRKKLLEALGSGSTVPLGVLAERGLVSIRPEEEEPCVVESSAPGEPLVLTPGQAAAFAPLAEALYSGKAETHLLFGITGSGKTAVYMELARRALAAGRSVLLLAPEVALALKLWAEAERLLPHGPRFLFHGYQSAVSREQTFRRLADCDVPALVIGTRSALFLPVSGVGLIVLDEEHDSSFKQDEGFNYQAKEVAWFRAGQSKALLLPASATPDIKTFYAAKEGRIPLHVLEDRVGGGTLPAVELVPLSKGRKDEGLLAPQSMAALKETVAAGKQAVILLNRRGYAPLMYCLSCGVTAKCPSCDIGLAYHKGRERLLCHYCGWSVPFPSPCSSCRGMHFLPMGEGTEKLEEELAAVLPPGAGVLRLDRDNTRRPGRMEEILAAFARKEAQVLVGTQMLSKGHHFPDVTLAVAADADLGLNLPDYRAAERTFQLLVQASGRAGRGEDPGRVLIQTRNTDHYCWEYVKNADYEGFYEQELALRQKRRYPPFVRLGLLRVSFEMHEKSGLDEVNRLGARVREAGKMLGVGVLGPAPAPLPILQGRKRFHCLLKADDWGPIRRLYAEALKAAGKGSLRIRLDLDPVNML